MVVEKEIGERERGKKDRKEDNEMHVSRRTDSLYYIYCEGTRHVNVAGIISREFGDVLRILFMTRFDGNRC